MNILQAACYFSADNIIKYLANSLSQDKEVKKVLAEWREPYGGN
jgi:hypothetical protein